MRGFILGAVLAAALPSAGLAQLPSVPGQIPICAPPAIPMLLSGSYSCLIPAQQADVSGLASRVTTLEAQTPVPGPKGDTGPAGMNANLVAATLTSLGSIKANISVIQRTTAPVSVNVPAISVLGLTALAATSTATVPGVQLGDVVQVTFAAAPPTGLVPTGAVVTAANTVVVTFAATQALTLAAGAQSLNFVWTR